MRKILILSILATASLPVVAQTQRNYAAQVNSGHPSVVLDFNDPTTSFLDHRSGLNFVPSTTGTVTPHVAGFDNRQPNNTAASFTYNSFAKSPNNTIADFEWSQPFSLQLQLNRLAFSRSSHTATLLTKGDTSYTGFNSKGYGLFLFYDPDGAGTARLCIQYALQGGFQNVLYQHCTATNWDNPDTYNYNIVVTHDGTGSPAGDSIYVNGTKPLQLNIIDANRMLGMVQIAVSGGTAYANSTPFTVTGGGPNCVVTGVMHSTSGVPSSITFDAYTDGIGQVNYGCTSNPTVALTAPSGSGAVLTATANTATMSDTSHPLYLLGSYAGGSEAGFGTSGDSPMIADEFAVYPSVVSQENIQSAFVHTAFYQLILTDLPADPPYVIYSNDGCEDMDNMFSLQVAIGAHLRGYIHLIAVSSDAGGRSGQIYRQMLDAAGLHHIPVTQPSVSFGGNTVCGSQSIVTDYNASTLDTFPNDVTVLRTVLAALPSGKKAAILFGGVDRILTDLMQSSADGISALSGQDLFEAKVSGVFFEGMGGTYPTFTGASYNSFNDPVSGAYVLSHNGSVPLNFFPGTPGVAGPGAEFTRVATDPLHLLVAFNGQETRTCWDCLPTVNFMTDAFRNSPTCGTMTMDSSTGLVSGDSTTDSHHCIYPMGDLAQATAQGQVFTWFLNSLINVAPQGFPRSQ